MIKMIQSILESLGANDSCLDTPIDIGDISTSII